jgi:hypothetical protein
MLVAFYFSIPFREEISLINDSMLTNAQGKQQYKEMVFPALHRRFDQDAYSRCDTNFQSSSSASRVRIGGDK